MVLILLLPLSSRVCLEWGVPPLPPSSCNSQCICWTGTETQFTAKFATAKFKHVVIVIPATGPRAYVQLIFKILEKMYSEGLWKMRQFSFP